MPHQLLHQTQILRRLIQLRREPVPQAMKRALGPRPAQIPVRSAQSRAVRSLGSIRPLSQLLTVLGETSR
jgi:hypothetical protein